MHRAPRASVIAIRGVHERQHAYAGLQQHAARNAAALRAVDLAVLPRRLETPGVREAAGGKRRVDDLPEPVMTGVDAE